MNFMWGRGGGCRCLGIILSAMMRGGGEVAVTTAGFLVIKMYGELDED